MVLYGSQQCSMTFGTQEQINSTRNQWTISQQFKNRNWNWKL